MYKLVVFVPQTHIEKVKQALFDAGAGRIGNYDQCCWQAKGRGQYRPLAGSVPYLGEVGNVEYVDEYRLEMVSEEGVIKNVVSVLKDVHPYEEPAYDIWRVEEFS